MKDMLMLIASEDISEHEALNIFSQANLYGINTDVHRIDSFEKLYKVLNSGKSYDYIYLATHGCGEFWGNISGTVQIPWTTFAATICGSQVLKDGSVFLHSCCRGGLNQVAYSMFAICHNIEFICGPRTKAYPADLITAFNLFLYYVEIKKIDPVRAAEKVLNATDIRLACFDKAEVTTELSYMKHVEDNQDIFDKAYDFVVDYKIIEHEKNLNTTEKNTTAEIVSE